MITSIRFENYKVLRRTTLPLSRVTLLVGPNGSGKTTVLSSLEHFKSNVHFNMKRDLPVDLRSTPTPIRIELEFDSPRTTVTAGYDANKGTWNAGGHDRIRRAMTSYRSFSFDATAISNPVQLAPNVELGTRGEALAGVLDRLRDQHPERFDALNRELIRCMPEFDRVLFDTPGAGQRAFMLRRKEGQHSLHAQELSQGTLIALAILTLSYLPSPPEIIGLEEPDRGIHPRLLRDIRDAIYRLAYPESCGEAREPVQVIATTHSPYFLDLFRDHPEEIVVAEREPDNVRFEKLSEREDIEEILGETHLGDAWYSGILGGIPAHR